LKGTEKIKKCKTSNRGDILLYYSVFLPHLFFSKIFC